MVCNKCSKLSGIGVLRSLCVGAAALFGAGAAHAGAAYTTEDSGATLVVTVDSDGATLDANEVVAGITKIAKRGPGRLTATPIPSYAGDFDIEEGIWCTLVAGDFGVTNSTYSGTIDVRDGASIEYAGSVTNPRTLEGKTVNLYGAAAAGTHGKIFLSSNIQMGGWEGGLGLKAKFYLRDADTTFWSRARLAICGTFDLGGHVLTLDGGSSRSVDLGGTITNGGSVVVTPWTIWMTQSTGLKFAPDCAANSYIHVMTGAVFNIKDKRTYANGWTIRNDGGTITCNTQRSPTSTDIGWWEGPIVLSGDTVMGNYGAKIGGWSISNSVVNLAGPLSGEGTLLVGPTWLNLRHADNTYSGQVTVRGKGTKRSAGSNENVVPPGAGGLGIWNGASVFTNASSITLKDSARVEFFDDAAASVGALKFVGDTSTFTDGDPGDDTQSIMGGSATNRSTIAGLTKTGTNTLVVGTTAHFTGTATISEGILKVPYRSTKGTPGLYETHIMPISPGDPKWDDGYIWEGSWTGANNKWPISHPWLPNYQEHLTYAEKGVCMIGPQRGLKPMINSGLDWNWDDGYSKTKTGRNGWWYHGYIWNHSDQPVTYTFWCGLQNPDAIMFGEEHDMVFFPTDSKSELYGDSVKVPAAKSYTLQPGATRVDIIVWSSAAPKTVWSFSLPSNGERHGLVYAPASVCTAEQLNAQIVAFYNEASPANTNAVRDTLRQFSEFRDDSGIGTLFTADIYGDGDVDKKVVLLPVFDDLVFASGTTLDLDGNLDFCVRNLTGSPTVVNSVRFTVTNNWTICAADFPNNDSTVRRPMTVDGKLVFAEGSTFAVDDESAIARGADGVVVATATGGVVGCPASQSASRCRLYVSGNEVRLLPKGSFNVILR